MSTTDVRRKLAAYGGRPARDKLLPPPYPGALFIGEEEKRAVVEVIESQSLFRYYGPRLLGKVDALEREFAKAIGVSRALAVSSGLAEVSGDRVSVLADSAEGAAEIDAAAAERERAKAEEEMKSAGVDTLDEIRTRLELAQARIAVARRPA